MNSSMFTYKSSNYPLYFHEPLLTNSDCDALMFACHKEFLMLLISDTEYYDKLLSNGVTFGEYGIWWLQRRHDRRKLRD
jgi:hypothetical protein